MDYERQLEICEDVLITTDHYFDVVGKIYIGRGTIIAGRRSQFWTHGFAYRERNIEIGNNCYIGSATSFIPGTSVADNTIVGLGSVVTKNFHNKFAMIGGNPAIILKEDYNWRKKTSPDCKN